MSNFQSRENKFIIVLFFVVLLLFGGVFVAREYIYYYIETNIDLDKTTFDLFSPTASREIDISNVEVIDVKIFDKEEFQELQRNPISLPRFNTGKKNPFSK